MPFGIDVSMPWHVRFFEHANHDGDSFTLGVVQQTDPIVAINPAVLSLCDWDRDLTKRNGPCNGRWNDCISSVRSIGPSKSWVLFEHVNFQGDAVYGEGDEKDLANRGFNDKCSSIIMCSAPTAVLKAAVAILIV